MTDKDPHAKPQDTLREDAGARDAAEYVDGAALGLVPTKPIDLGRVKTFSDLLEGMRDTAFSGRSLGEAADILEHMVRDEGCIVVGTFSGAMTVAKQGLVLCDMIENGMIDVVVSTGALMTHGLVEATGMRHFKVNPDMDDRELYYQGFDRVYDTLESEKNLDDLEAIFDKLLGDWPEGEVASSAKLTRMLGGWLRDHTEGRGILKSAVEHDVPVYIPAFTDSELGLDFAIHNRRRQKVGKSAIAFNPFLDLEDYAEKVHAADHVGIFTIGGGVPRNWAQQVSCYLDLLRSRAGMETKLQRFRYGIRICPEPVHWGGLSGCTYSEGVSWGKFVPTADGGRYAEVYADATLVWPLLVAGVLERVKK